jgi:Na+/H+-dicarboxylate symporter
VSDIFIRLLQFLSLPLLFFALVSTLSGLDNWRELATLGRQILKYTLFTTYIAALIGLLFLLILEPQVTHEFQEAVILPEITHNSYWQFLWKIIPNNFFQAFVENNVMGVAFIGILLGLSILKLDDKQKETCKELFSGLFSALLNMAQLIIALMPLGVWAFVTLLVQETLVKPEQFQTLMLYTACVLGANVVQGVVVLPLLLKSKGISPGHTFKGVLPALTTAFFTKSSSATLPVTLKCLKERLHIDTKTANTVTPLCTVVNMNGCAAFIVITVLFVSMHAGIHFSAPEMLLWTVMATIAAVGNAGIPMGCYFLTSAFLVSMNVPLTVLGWILPIYVIIDMVETALNVWSDVCITSIIGAQRSNI